MTDPAPRSFIWLQANGQLRPNIWFGEPRVGCEGLKPIAEHKLEPSEYSMTLDDLIAKYPAPEMV